MCLAMPFADRQLPWSRLEWRWLSQQTGPGVVCLHWGPRGKGAWAGNVTRQRCEVGRGVCWLEERLSLHRDAEGGLLAGGEDLSAQGRRGGR